MPHKHTLRKFTEGGYYHIYNRGVEKRKIFLNDNDYSTFLSIVEYYLTPKDKFEKLEPNVPTWRQNLEDNEVELLSYCLMPNHFHLLARQNSRNGITKFMRRLSNSYVCYFNKKANRVGSLFQGKYKASLITSEEYLIHLSKYIHKNPSDLEVGPLEKYKYSSYPTYLNITQTEWLSTSLLKKYFKNHNRYRYFVESKNIPLKLPEDIRIDAA